MIIPSLLRGLILRPLVIGALGVSQIDLARAATKYGRGVTARLRQQLAAPDDCLIVATHALLFILEVTDQHAREARCCLERTFANELQYEAHKRRASESETLWSTRGKGINRAKLPLGAALSRQADVQPSFHSAGSKVCIGRAAVDPDAPGLLAALP